MDAQRIDTGGAHLTGLESTVWEAQLAAYGSREGSPFVLLVGEDGALLPLDLPGHGHVTSVAGDESTLVSVQDGSGMRLFGIPTPGGWSSPGRPEAFALDDEHTRAASRLWVANGSEDPGYVVTDPDGRLTGVDPGGDGVLPDAGRLRLAMPDTPLLVSQGEVDLYVAGDLADAEQEPRQSLWTIHVYGTQEVPLEVSFSAFTDICNERDPCIAGHHQGRAVLVTSSGRALPAPPAHLDPAHPVVLVARTGELTVVLQATGGIEAWMLSDHEWDVRPLPGGRLDAARCDASDDPALWYVADNELWRLSG